MSRNHRPPAHHRHVRAPHQRTRTFDWLTARKAAEVVPCPPHPKGCGAPAGETCRNPQSGEELGQQPAHDAREKAAAAAAAAPEATGPQPDTEETSA